MARLLSGLVRLVADARGAFRAAPIEASLALLAAATFSVGVAQETWPDTSSRLLVTFSLAIPATFAFTLLHALGALRAGMRWALSLAAVALAGAFAFGDYDPDLAAFNWRLGLLHATSALLPFAAITLGADRDRSWWIQARLLLRVAVAAAYGVALFVGIAIAIFAIDQLFELDIDDDVYAHLGGWTFFALVPWIVVGGRDALVGPASPRAEGVRRIAGLAATFFAAPLAVGYTAILYAYAVRVAVTGEVPKNLLSPLVIGAGALWLLLAFLIEPIRGDADAERPGQERDEAESTAAKAPAEAPGSTALTRLARWLPPALLPMLALGIWAVVVRIQQYGWTEFRYVRLAVLAALVVLAAAGTARLLTRSRGEFAHALDTGGDGADAIGAGNDATGLADISGDVGTTTRPGRATYHGNRTPLPWAAVPVVLALAAFLSAVGPWSAPAATRRSQQARLAAAIEQARRIAGVPGAAAPHDSAGAGPAVASDTSGTNAAIPGTTRRRPIPSELYTTINETAVFLARHFGPEALEEVVGFDPGNDYAAWYTVADSLGFVPGPAQTSPGTALLVFAWRPDTLAVHGLVGGSLYSIAVGMERTPGQILPIARRPGCPGVVVSFDPEEETALVPIAGERAGVRFTLEPRAARVVVQDPTDGRRLTADLRSVADSVAERSRRDCSVQPAILPREALQPLRDDAGNPHGQILVDEVELLIPADTSRDHATGSASILRRIHGRIILPPTR